MADPNSGIEISPSDRDMAIRTMLGEEGSPDGMAGVAATILNRAQSGAYGGRNITGVVLAPGQFEPWSARPADLMGISETDPRYLAAGQIFDGVASGKIPDLTNGATHFYAPSAQRALGRAAPAWATGQPIQLGQTNFYAPVGPSHYQPPVEASASASPAPAKSAAAPAAPDPSSDPVLGKYLKPMDPEKDPVFSRYLKPLPAAEAATAPAAAPAPAPVNPENDPVLSRYLKPLPGAAVAENAPPGSFPLGDPRNQGMLPFSYREGNLPPVAPPVDNSVWGQVADDARAAKNYLVGQIAATPGAIAENLRNSAALAGQGENEVAAGNILPSFPSIDPRTWSAGGALKTATGYLGAAMSPISGLVQTGVEQPVTDLTGDPEIGARAGFVANTLAGPALSRVLQGAPGAIANKLVGGMSYDDATLAALARDKYGIPLNAGQMSSSVPVKFAGSVADRMPFSGAGAANSNIQNAFTRAVSNTFGEDTPRITPSVMQAAKTRLGNEFDDIASHTTIKVDPQFVQDIHSALNDAKSVLPDAEVKPLLNQVQRIYDTIDPKTGQISGETYQALTRKGTPLDNLMNSANPNTRFYAGQLRDALDGAMQRSAPPDLANQLSTARSQYKAMKTIEDLVEKSPTGTLSPSLLMGAVRNSYGSMAYNGGGDLGNLARIGQRFLKEPPSSGTAERLANMNMFQKLGAAGGALMGVRSAADMMTPTSAIYAAGSIPASLAAGRAIGGALRSNWLAKNMLARGLGTVPANPIGAADLIPATAGALTTPGLSNKFLNAP